MEWGTTGVVGGSLASSNKDVVIDRTLAVGVGGVPSGTVIDGRIYSKLTSSNASSVIVRSPITCEAEEGICAKCFGLQSNGRLPSIGENIGVQQAQAIVEPLANAKLKSFHTGGSASGASSMIDRVDEVVNLKRPRGSAILLADEDYGPKERFTIVGVDRQMGGSGATGHIIRYRPVGGGPGEEIRIPPGRDIIVSVGSEVRNGEPLTKGPIDPNELHRVRGFRATQRYIAGEIKDLIGVRKRTAETMTAAMGRTSRVLDAGDSDYTPFDTVPTGRLTAFNARAQKNGMAPISF